jgi:hypothetical protein
MSSSDGFRGRRSGAASLALFFTWHSTSFASRLLSLLPAFPRRYFSTATATTLRPEIQLLIAKSPSSLHLFKYPHLSPALPIAYHHVVSHRYFPSINHPPRPRIIFILRSIQCPQQHYYSLTTKPRLLII